MDRPVLFALALLAMLAIRLPAADSLDNWTRCASGAGQNLYGATYAAGHYVCVGQAGTVLVSSNGLVWQSTATGVTNDLYGVAWGNGGFVAAGSGGLMLWSSNSLDWAVEPAPTTNQLNAVAFCGGRFMANGVAGTILTSTDGLNWTAQTTPTTRSLTGCAYGNGLFVVVGRGSSNPGTILTSSNGVDWVDRSALNLGVAFYGVAFGHGVFIAMDARGVAYSSPDANSWARHYTPNGSYVFGLTFAQGLFVGVGGPYSGGGQKIVTSPDGLNWLLRPVSVTNSAVLRAITYGNGYFVAAGDKGLVLRSGPVATLRLGAVSESGAALLLEGEIGRVYALQACPSLLDPQWTDILTVTNRSEITPLLDPQPGDSRARFYQLRLQ